MAYLDVSKEASSESSLQISNPSISGGNGNGFLSHRPMSAGIDSIVQGFKFAATSRKPLVTAVVETGNQVNGNGKTRERIGNNDALQSRVGCAVGRQDKDGIEAMKIQVPLFSAATTVPSLLHNPLNPQVVLPPEASAPREQMLPPFQSIRPIERGQKTMPLQGLIQSMINPIKGDCCLEKMDNEDIWQYLEGKTPGREENLLEPMRKRLLKADQVMIEDLEKDMKDQL
ncbi:hypothetical protein DFP73DRAFT_522828 [Morchella snyderi]|nr:hypothetical protein DFP73DRAFT_522828 [Morchella snyderi]